MRRELRYVTGCVARVVAPKTRRIHGSAVDVARKVMSTSRVARRPPRSRTTRSSRRACHASRFCTDASARFADLRQRRTDAGSIPPGRFASIPPTNAAPKPASIPPTHGSGRPAAIPATPVNASASLPAVAQRNMRMIVVVLVLDLGLAGTGAMLLAKGLSKSGTPATATKQDSPAPPVQAVTPPARRREREPGTHTRCRQRGPGECRRRKCRAQTRPPQTSSAARRSRTRRPHRPSPWHPRSTARRRSRLACSRSATTTRGSFDGTIADRLSRAPRRTCRECGDGREHDRLRSARELPGEHDRGLDVSTSKRRGGRFRATVPVRLI